MEPSNTTARQRLASLLAITFAPLLVVGGGALSPAAQAPGTPTASASAEASEPGRVHAGAPTWCESRFLAPLKTQLSSKRVEEWTLSPPGSDKPTANVGCAKCATTEPGSAETGDAGRADATFAANGHGDEANSSISAAILPYRSQLERIVAVLGTRSIGVVVATLPDPTDSGLQYYFDAQLEALQTAVESAGYDRDQSWLPWADAQLRDEKARLAAEECRREMPGIILFRHATPSGPDETDLLLLLLVGEAPTYGVQKAALRRAFEFAEAVAPSRDLRIVGPTFSGSAFSLRQTLDDFRGTRAVGPHVTVTSGAANSREVPRTLRGPIDCKANGRRPLEFKITTVLEDEIQCAFLRYIAELQLHEAPTEDGSPKPLKGVAFLRESGTAFGKSTIYRAMGDTGTAKAVTETHAPCRDDDGDGGAAPIAGAVPDYGCGFVPELDLRFPMHVSAVRDAYETLDAERARAATSGRVVARSTVLDVSLRERTQARDVENETSMKTALSRDLVLTQLLGTLSREGVRYVGVQATDSADVIFLARKIRDVAPDVRLAIFGSDILYLHPAFRHDLLGSYVVTPYPFFGATSFRSRATDGETKQHTHMPFDGALAEGTHNAVLVALAKGPNELAEYDFMSSTVDAKKHAPPLPVWITAIGKTGIAPIAVRVPDDCDDLIAGREIEQEPNTRAMCDRRGSADYETVGRKKGIKLRDYTLTVDAEATPLNLWQFVFATLMVVVLLDGRFIRAIRNAMPTVDIPEEEDNASRQRAIDITIIRTKYAFYAIIRRLILAAGVIYMLLIQRMAIATYASQHSERRLPTILFFIGVVVAVATLADVIRSLKCYLAWRNVLRDALPKHERERAEPKGVSEGDPSASRRITRTLGRLRILSAIVGAVAGLVLLGLGDELFVLKADPGDFFDVDRQANPNVAMFVLRALPLVNGVSPVAPVLAWLLCSYILVSARMSRVRGMHTVALMTPAGGAHGRGCTPIAHMLYPDDSRAEKNGFRDSETRLVDSIMRPSDRHSYLYITLGAALFALLVFVLKPPTSLEGERFTWVLFALLGSSAIVITATLVQLALYWRSLSALLTRIQTHPLFESFDDVPGPLKESVDSQVSQKRDDLRRYAACVRCFEDLVRTQRGSFAAVEGGFAASKDHEEFVSGMDEALTEMERLLAEAQRERVEPLRVSESSEGGAIGRALVTAASKVSERLTQIWDGRWGVPILGETRPARAGGARGPDERVDAMTRFEARASASTIAWLRRAHAFVAAVVALILNRHVRQFRIFLYALTSAGLALLVAISSYAFQPRRLLISCIWVIMGSIVIGCAYVYVQLDRNALLSKIAGTKAGEIELNAAFVARIVGWVGLPLLSVAAAQYPQVGSVFFAWTEPFINALK